MNTLGQIMEYNGNGNIISIVVENKKPKQRLIPTINHTQFEGLSKGDKVIVHLRLSRRYSDGKDEMKAFIDRVLK